MDGIFIEVGLSPSSEIVKDLVELNKVREIVINPLNNETSVEGIFAAGDVTSIKQKQIILLFIALIIRKLYVLPILPFIYKLQCAKL